MAIRKKYRKSPEILTNYDFTDVVANVGYITFYGISDEADSKKLVRQAIESTDVKSDIQGTTGNVESNFDYTFNISQLVKGDLYVTITILANDNGTGTCENDTTVEIFHYDGSTETSIGTQQSIAQLSATGGAQEEARHTLTFDVNKRFNKGDILRVEVITTVTGNNSNDFASHYHDGANRDFSLTDQHGVAAPSNLIVLVPFDLDL